MTDVFLSYAHDDQGFARLIAQGLEAEGFLVWWDHTIPPGKTWDTHIAAGIEAAKACVVVWSAHSVDSDWVKEEATLARDADKFLPVALDESHPPVGFRRIQAARLAGWNGDRNHPHWRLLVGEVRNLIQGRTLAPPPMVEQAPPVVLAAPPPAYAPPPPAYTPPPPAYAPPPDYASPPPTAAPQPAAPSAANPLVRVLAVAAVVAGLAIAGYFGFSALNREGPAQAPAASLAPAPPTAAPAPAVEPAEAERLRQERDAALAQAQETQRLAEEQAAEATRLETERQAAEQEARRRAAAAPIDMTGVWDGQINWSTGSSSAITWEFFSDGSMLTSFGSIGAWRANGQSVQVTFDVGARYDGAFRNGVYSGDAVSMEGDPGTFQMWRR